jgi:DNA-binding transcriptional LysR family regulator
LSQPALSKSLRRLEQILAVKLFDRTPKGVELTAEGTMLLLRVRELRLSLRNVTREISEMSDGRAGQLKVGVGAPVPEQFLSKAFADLIKHAPRTKLLVTNSDGDLLFPALHNGDLDVIVSYLRPAEGLVCEHLYDDEFAVCASASHRLAGRKDLTLGELAQERWTLAEPTLISQCWLLDQFRAAGLVPPRVVFESRSLALKLQMVACSDLLTFAPRSVFREFALASAVTTLLVKTLAWPFSVSVIYRKETSARPTVGRFVDIIKGTAQAMRVTG